MILNVIIGYKILLRIMIYDFYSPVFGKANMSIEKPPLASGLARTRSEQLYETLAAAIKSPFGSMDANGVPATAPAAIGGGRETLSRKSSRRLMMSASPGRSGGAGTHIRKSRSAQLKLELDEVSSGAALSRASSASLGLSFSFTGFAMPPEEISDSKPFSDDEMIRKSSSEPFLITLFLSKVSFVILLVVFLYRKDIFVI